MMTGLGVGAGLAIATPALTAVAAPVTNHRPAWGPFYQDLTDPVAGLTYVNIDGAAFAPQNEPGYLDSLTGAGVSDNDGQMIAPLLLPVGSVVHQVNIGYFSPASADISLQIFERDFLADGNTAWMPIATGVAPGGDGALTATINFTTPATIAHGRSYTLQFRAAVPGTTVRGVTIGYLPPTAGFVPFSGATPRVYDSRTGDGKLGFQEERPINLGNPGVRGALFNLTVTETENSGFVAAFAGDITYPNNSSINYFGTNQNLANGVVTAVAPDGTIKIRGGGPAGRAHVVIDRLGWFI